MKQLLAATVLVSGLSFAGGFELKGDAAKGEAHYKTLCVSCHGEKGEGNGAAAAALTPKPANFTDAKRAAEIDDEYVYTIIKEGGAAKGKSPLMVAWKGSLKEQELRDVTAYVRAFAKAAPAAAAPAKDAKDTKAAPAKDAKPAPAPAKDAKKK